MEEVKTPKQRKDFRDIGFTAIANPIGDDKVYVVRFEIYTIVGTDCDRKVYWQKRGVPTRPKPVENIDDAELYLHGDVKWDGCSNWYFYEQDRVMLHFCGLKDIQSVGQVMERCWHWAGELMTNWEGD